MPLLASSFSRILPRATRIALYGALLLGLAFAVVVMALRYWLLPNIEAYRMDIAEAVSRAAQQRITIGKIDAGWEGLRPHLSLGAVTVFDAAGQPALMLDRVESTLSWWSLVSGQLNLHSLEIERPELDVRRDLSGAVSIAGMVLNRPDADSSFADWLLSQRRIVIRDARIAWRDQQRQAPQLLLTNVNLRLENSGRHHRFGLRAVPPAQLATPLDLRGDLVGNTLADGLRWRGTLYTELDYADVAAWRQWFEMPLELQSGSGALRAWLEFDAGKVTRVTADLRLRQVQTRLAPDLPELNLDWLRGRLGWTWLPDQFAVLTEKLSLSTHQGVHLESTDFSFKLLHGGPGRHPEGEVRLNALDLGALATVADHLPLPAGWRGQLQLAAPTGTLRDLTLSWRGQLGPNEAWQLPQEYGVQASFANLSMRPFGPWPAFSGVSGEIVGDESKGRLLIDFRNGSLDLPKLFEQPLALDALAGQLDWTKGEKALEYQLRKMAFANAHLAGSISGSVRSDGMVDLQGSLTRADARQVWRYLPLTVAQDTRDWLRQSLLAGQSSEVKLLLKGKLADFPFADPAQGVFRVSVKGVGGALDYVPGWPRLENITADLLFSGKRMEILAHQANILGAKLNRVKVVIPDLESYDEQLEVTGEAAGATAGFLKFIEQSPVRQMVGDFTEGIAVEGDGKLKLKLNLPLRRLQDTRLRGEYQFLANRIAPDPGLPPLERVNGKLEFSESMARISNAQALIFGGPASIDAASAPDGNVRVVLTGRADFDNWQKISPQPLLAYLHGGADWRGSVMLRKQQAEVLFESDLRGMASDLPAPLAKKAGEGLMLRFEKKSVGAQRDKWQFNYGNLLSGQLLRRKGADGMRVERGAIVFGGNAVLPGKRGMWLSGALRNLNLDQWRSVIKLLPEGSGLNVTRLDLQLGELDAIGHRFHNLHIVANAQEGDWQVKISGHEIAGGFVWRPQDQGRLTARLKYLTFADSTPTAISPRAALAAAQSDLPGLDIEIDQFQLREKQLGKLVLLAVPQGRDWLIEKLYLYNPDGSVTADGVWRSWVNEPRTQVNVALEVNDIGKFFTRFGLPEGIKGGSAELSGPLSWAGSPAQLDYPSLSGELALTAKRGQFVKLEPGIGKLLGVLSLQALPRRVTLDFKDIFSQGFAFEEIAAHVKIARGVANTNDFAIYGSTAKVAMSGDIDLVGETQNLRVVVLPTVGESVSVAGALLGGPVAGITAFIVQKLLKDPLDRLVSYQYGVTGTWTEPVVTKLQPQLPQN